MKKEDIIMCINYYEKEITRLKTDISSLIKFNIDTAEIEKKIQNYEVLIQQLNRKLLNSNYKIDQCLLAEILEDFLTEVDLLENSGLQPRSIRLIPYVLEELKK